MGKRSTQINRIKSFLNPKHSLFLRREEWTATKPMEMVVDGLSEKLGKPTEDRKVEKVWNQRSGIIYFYRVLTDINSGEVIIEYQLTPFLKLLPLLALLLSAISLGTSNLATIAGLIILNSATLIFVYYPPKWATDDPREHHCKITSWKTTPFFPPLVLVTFYFYAKWIKLSPMPFSNTVSNILILFLLVFVLYSAIIEEAFPSVSLGSGVRTLLIPSHGIVMLALAVSWPVLYGFVPGMRLYQLSDGETSLAKLRNEPSPGQSVDPLTGNPEPTLASESFDFLIGIMPSLILISGFCLFCGALYLFLESQSIKKVLSQTQLTPINNQWVKLGGFLFFIAVNVFGFITGIVSLSITLFGVVNKLVLPESVFFVIPEAFQPEVYLQLTYYVLDDLFLRMGFSNPRLVSVGLFIYLSSLQISFIIMWVRNLFRHVASVITILTRGEKQYFEIEQINDGVDIYVLNHIDELPVIRPISLFFGRWQFIVVSEGLLTMLDEDELNAVIAHELYHIQERDMVVNAIASVFAVMIGGRNALLAFYDYPAIEREADRFAAEKIGLLPLITAIRNLDSYEIPTQKESVSIEIGTPGFIEIQEFEPNSHEMEDSLENIWKRASTIYRKVDEIGEAPYQVFFGRVLLDEAHLEADARIASLTVE